MEEYCSFHANVTGIKFYSGINELHPMMHARLGREELNPFDSKSVLVFTFSGNVLGHLEKKTAAVIAPIMDTMPLGELQIKR